MRDLYNQNRVLITKIKACVYAFRRQNNFEAMMLFSQIMSPLQAIIIKLLSNQDYFNENRITVDEAYLMEVFNHLNTAQEQQDDILLADYMELQLLPLLISWQEVIQSKEQVVEWSNQYEKNMRYLKEKNKELYEIIQKEPLLPSHYFIEPTTNGSLTIHLKRKEDYYLLSNHDPEDAGRIFADYYYSPEKENYILYGMELLVNANALINHKNVARVDVYESDIHIIKLALLYGNLYHLTTNRLQLHYDPDYSKFALASKEDNDSMVVLHRPSIRNIKQEKIKERFEQLFVVDSSIRNQKEKMLANFKSNIMHCNHYVDELLTRFEDKNVFLIAAGPSLDKNIHLLKNRPHNSIILAVGTVHKKLVGMGIIPDYTVFSDANVWLLHQIQGIEKPAFPMLVLSSTYRELAIMNQGEKYLICQKDFEEAYQYALQNGHQLYQSGGSVTTIALDVCMRLKARQIILLGADMAITNNQSHASQTAGLKTVDTKGMIPVESIEGGVVYSTRVLSMYREWIERRILEEPSTKVIDATEGGALIHGTRVCSLQQILEEISIKD